MIINYQGMASHIMYQETWELIKYGFKYLTSSNMANIEQSVTKAATLGEILFPNGQIHNDLAGFLEIEKNGGIKNIASNLINQCAKNLDLNIDKAKGIAHCLEVAFAHPNANVQDQLISFNECHPMNPLEAVQVVGNAINLAQCLKDGITDTIHEL